MRELAGVRDSAPSAIEYSEGTITIVGSNVTVELIALPVPGYPNYCSALQESTNMQDWATLTVDFCANASVTGHVVGITETITTPQKFYRVASVGNNP